MLRLSIAPRPPRPLPSGTTGPPHLALCWLPSPSLHPGFVPAAMDGASVAVSQPAADETPSLGARSAPSLQNDRYDMAGVRKACIICVHKGRDGSGSDLNRLRQLLHNLEFNVTEIINPAGRDVIDSLKHYRDGIEPGTCCSLVFIMAHGDPGRIMGADNKSVELKEIFGLFNNKECKSLQQRPKVFVVQACRGHGYDEGVPFSTRFRALPSEPKKIPTVSDTFIVYPSAPGHVSYRCPVEGSYMIKFMVDIFEECGEGEHLYDLFVKVNRKMTEESYGSKKYKTTLVMESTLTKSFYLKPPAS